MGNCCPVDRRRYVTVTYEMNYGKKTTIKIAYTLIYALGATFFKLLTGQPPPSADELVSDGNIVKD